MSKFARVASGMPYHLQGRLVTIEVDVSVGLHAFTIVGLPDKSVDESRERVGAALKYSGYSSPRHSNAKTTVALAPAELRKEGSYFDVAIAVGYLLAQSEITADVSGILFVGELSLDGLVRPVHGILSIALLAQSLGYHTVIVPADNAAEAALVSDVAVYGAQTLVQVLDHIDSEKQFTLPLAESVPYNPEPTTVYDLKHIKGQDHAKRALLIAAIGGHNISLFGSPGTGKTMLAQAFVQLLPPLDFEQSLQVTAIHSIAGKLVEPLIVRPPLRSPHHTASHVSLIGGGADLRPGEITLAHHGVLFMDEFPEFDQRVLESLRQPLEDRVVTISRARGSVQYPANFTLLAALNPCPCGYRGSQVKQCVCLPRDLHRYQKKLSGPIVDRIDLWVSVEHIEYEKLDSTESGMTSGDAIDHISAALEFGASRRAAWPAAMLPAKNSALSAKHLPHIGMTQSATKLLQQCAAKLSLSPRSYHRIQKVARTIADMAQSSEITDDHILEALQYRPKW